MWSSDGQRIAYGLNAEGESSLILKSATGAGREVKIMGGKGRILPSSWSANGKWIAYSTGQVGRYDMFLVEAAEGAKPIPLAASKTDEFSPRFSPDGRWITYVSRESGRGEVYVMGVPEAAGGTAEAQGKWQVSRAGGWSPRWRADGKELFFVGGDRKMMAAPIESSPAVFRSGEPAALFTTRLFPDSVDYSYDVSADGRRFLLLDSEEGGADPITVLVNWDSLLMRRGPPSPAR